MPKNSACFLDGDQGNCCYLRMTKISDTLLVKLKDKPRKEVKRGEIIYSEGDHPQYVWVVEQGMLGLFHIAENGKETFLRVFGKGYLLGHRSLIAGENYHASAVALTASRLIPMNKDRKSTRLNS